MSYHGFGISFEASASTSGGASASSSGGGGGASVTGPKTAIPMGPQCGAGFRPNAMYATTPTALLPKLPISPLCLPLPAAPAQPALQPPAVSLKVPVYSSAAIAAMKAKPGISPNLLFMSSTPTAPVIEESGVGTYVLIGLAVLAVGGAGYYAYKKMGPKKATPNRGSMYTISYKTPAGLTARIWRRFRTKRAARKVLNRLDQRRYRSPRIVRER